MDGIEKTWGAGMQIVPLPFAQIDTKEAIAQKHCAKYITFHESKLQLLPTGLVD
jgi:hypothetical protein